MGIEKVRRRLVAPRIDTKPVHDATRMRGFVLYTGASYLSTAKTSASQTISVASLISTAAIAVLIKQRVQDTVSTSFVEARPKVSVEANQRSKVRLQSVADTLVEGQAIIPIDSDGEFMWQRSGGVQTASLKLVGFFV